MQLFFSPSKGYVISTCNRSVQCIHVYIYILRVAILGVNKPHPTGTDLAGRGRGHQIPTISRLDVALFVPEKTPLGSKL